MPIRFGQMTLRTSELLPCSIDKSHVAGEGRFVSPVYGRGVQHFTVYRWLSHVLQGHPNQCLQST